MDELKMQLEAMQEKILQAIKDGYRIELKASKEGYLQVIQLQSKKIN